MKKYQSYNPQIDDTLDQEQNQVISSAPGQNTGAKFGMDTQGMRRSKNRQTAQSQSTQITQASQQPKKSNFTKFFKAEFWRNLAQNQTLRYVVGLFLGCLAFYLTISFVSYFKNCLVDQSAVTATPVGSLPAVANAGGEAGARLSNLLIDDTFGLGSAVIIFWLLAMTLKMFGFSSRFKTVNFTIKCFVALIAVSLIVGLLTIGLDSVVNWGGAHGRYVNEFIIGFLGWTGAVALSIFVLGVFVALCLRDFICWIIRLKRERDERRRIAREEREALRQKEQMIADLSEQEQADQVAAGLSEGAQEEGPVDEPGTLTFDAASYNLAEEAEEVDEVSGPETYDLEEEEEEAPQSESASAEESESSEKKDEEVSEEGETMVVKTGQIVEGSQAKSPASVGSEIKKYKFPSSDLLNAYDSKVEVDPEEQLENKERIQKTLADFGINILSIEATVGPTVTLYEIVPEKGIKIAKIRGLVDDIALRLAAKGVRIIAPIPGKGTVGIEVANKNKRIVSMRSIIRSAAYRNTRCKLPIAMGSTISNQVYLADLAKMPHLLVAGATGQGKSVGLNTIINSLLFCRRPDELKFVLIDPKMVEFSLYASIEDHYLAKMPGEEDAIITDISRVAPTLSSLCVEMDDRYQLLKKAQARNIEEYNAKYGEHKLLPTDGHRFLPYIVIIVDEFSDLIMQSGKEVEIPIARLAQKARAVGMHVIIATQRPSTDVITGLIKSNFPARIAFKTSQAIDSKTILDTTGAQQLIGLGDMLISFNSEMTRVQCALIETQEIKDICDYISRQPYAQGPYILPEPIIGTEDSAGADAGIGGDRDPLFEEVARMVVGSNTASTSSLQRHYSIGYTRAGRIMDQLERSGIVGPTHGGKPRQVLVDPLGLEDVLSNLS